MEKCIRCGVELEGGSDIKTCPNVELVILRMIMENGCIQIQSLTNVFINNIYI